MNKNEIAKLLAKLTEVAAQLQCAFENREPDAPPEALEKAALGLCLYCAEVLDDGGRTFRGAHERCYKRVNRAINAGTLTEIQAVERGYILPVTSKGGRRPPPDDPITTKEIPPGPTKKKVAKRGPRKRGS